MLRAHGYIGPEGVEDRRRATVVEADSVQCCHCGRHVLVAPGLSRREGLTDDGRATYVMGWCGRCAAPVCQACEARGLCVPFEARLAQAEARGRFLRQVKEIARP